MYTRDYKIFAPGEFYHVYNRGNHKQDIFLDDGDYAFFVLRLKQNLYSDKFDELKIQALPPNSFSLVSYCLMPNHFHLLIRQNSEIPVSKFMLKLCSSYAKVFNKKHEFVGHLFQDQFKQVAVSEDEYLKWLVAYICQNPTVAGLVKTPSEYKWSSYNEHVNRRPVSRVCDEKIVESCLENKAFLNLLNPLTKLLKKVSWLKK